MREWGKRKEREGGLFWWIEAFSQKTPQKSEVEAEDEEEEEEEEENCLLKLEIYKNFASREIAKLKQT